ncbi:MAG: helix-turn-helix domain-containing protein [Candidatus Hodarchaeota archaeon]
MTIKGEEETLNKVLEEIGKHPSVGRVEVKTRHPGFVSFLVDVKRCKACEVLIKSKAFMVFPVDIQKGRMKWLLITDENRTVGEISDALEKLGCETKIEKLIVLGEKGILTERQEEIIRLAFSSGYFDYPKRIGSLKLASKLGISVSTLSEVLRAAQRRIFSEYLRS